MWINIFYLGKLSFLNDKDYFKMLFLNSNLKCCLCFFKYCEGSGVNRFEILL